MISITGAEGSLWWGWHQAGLLRSWTMTPSGGSVALTGTLANTNSFAVSQRPLKFRVDRPTGATVWPLVSLQIADGVLSGTLGPPE